MTYPQDDSEALWVPPNVENPPRYAVGVLEEWNNATFANAVRYRGAVLRNLAVINGLEALGFAPGIQVSLLGHAGTGALTSFAILGRYVQPGVAATTEAIQALQSTVAKEISAEIFSSRIFAADDNTTVTTTDVPGYQDLGGPVVTDVEIGSSGVALVFLSTVISADNEAAVAGTYATAGGRMGFEVAGATTRAGANERSVAYFLQVQVEGTTPRIVFGSRSGTTVVVSGLNPGRHTFRALYARLFTGVNVSFSDRTIAVITF